MIKRKGPATVLGIILFAAVGWAALVGLVLTDNIWVGAALSLAGGVAIGAAVAYLMRKWWFKGYEKKEGRYF